MIFFTNAPDADGYIKMLPNEFRALLKEAYEEGKKDGQLIAKAELRIRQLASMKRRTN